MWDCKGSCQAYLGPCRVADPMLAAAALPQPGAPDAPSAAQSGRSSGVEHNLAKVGVEGSNPFARSSSSGHLTHPAKRRSHCWCVRRSGLCGSASWRIAMTEQAELPRTEPRDKLQTVNPATDEPGRP